MADLKKQLKDFKTIENSIGGNEYVFVSQNGNTRKTTINDVKKFTIGTEDMGTSATTIKGAIKEHEEGINNIATQLNKVTGAATYAKRQATTSTKDFYDNFSKYPDGLSIDGQNGYKVLAGAGTVTGGTLLVNTSCELNTPGIIIPAKFSEGKIRIKFQAGAKDFVFKFLLDYATQNCYTIWNNSKSADGSKICFGNFKGKNITKHGDFTLISDADFYVEIIVPTLYEGQVIELRSWKVSEARPTEPSLTYTLASGFLATTEGNVSVVSVKPDGAEFGLKEIIISNGLDYPSKLDNNYSFIGRWFTRIVNGETYACSINQGSEIYAKVFRTSTITANFLDISSSGNTPTIMVSIDGGAYTRYTLASNVSLATGLSALTPHTVHIIIDGIRESDNVWLQGQGVLFKGLTLDHLLGYSIPNMPQGRRILFIGDSITAGINVLGKGAIPTVNSGALAFPHIASNILGAIPLQVGFGRTGVIREGNGGVPNANVYYNFKMNLKPSEDNPEIIVINHGTNDLSQSTETDFKKAYQTLITKLKTLYGKIPIFLMRPFNGSFETQIQELCSTNIDCFYVDTTSWAITTTDGTHPNTNGHQVAGEKLSAFILNTLGETYFYN